MKIKRGSLLTVFLAMLCAALIALGVGFALPKSETKSANAASSLPISESDLNALATTAGYSSLLDLKKDLIENSNSLNASKFGSCEVTFGGMVWWPVYATAKDGNAVLTLWLKDSIGNYPWTDGTHSNKITNPNSNNYATSWIHAAINAGKTSYGNYYGAWVSNSSASPTSYTNSQKSSAAPCAPTDFTTFAAFVDGGAYVDYILPAGTVAFGSGVNEKGSYIGTGYSSEWTSDNIFLPSLAEAQSGGVWGCTSQHWQNIGSSGNQWLRTGYSLSYYDASALNTSASISNRGTDNRFGVRPAVHVNLSKFVAEPTDVEVTYDGNRRDIDDSEIDADDKAWYDSSIMDLTYPNANATDMIDADTYEVKVALNSDAVDAGYKFLGTPDSTKGAGDESDTVRYFNFKINQKEVTLPSLSGTKSYTATAQDFNFSDYDKDINNNYIVKVTGVEVKPNNGSTITLTSTGTNSWADGSGNYPVTLDDSGSIVKVSATDAGEYKVIIGLVDTTNYKWAPGVASDKKVAFTMGRADVAVTFGSPVATGGFSWKLGEFTPNTSYLTVQSINGVIGSENVTVDLYWYSDTNKSVQNSLYTTGVPDTTKLDATTFDSHGVDNYYLCAKLSNDASGANVNRNYKISTNDTNVTPQKNEVAAQKLVISAGVASVDDVKWQYQTAAMANPADYTGATLSYDKVSGSAVVYTMSITGIPNTWTATYGQDYSKSDANTYTAKVTIEIPAAEQANSKFPDPSGGTYTYAGEGNYTYISDSKCEITFDWTIDKKEVDLSSVKFEYTTDGGMNWTEYNSSNPPEADGATTYFEVRVPLTATTNLGVTGGPLVSNYGNQFGPGDVTFDLDFTFDSNHKAKSGQNEHQMPYTMKTTGKKLEVKWNRVQLTDSAGQPVKDAHGMPYFVYELDTSNFPADALQYIKYEYYTDNGGVIGSQITGGSDVVKHKNFTFITDSTGMNANSQNPKQVFVKVVLDGVPMMGPANDTPQYVFDTTSDPVDKRITVGDNRKAVDVTAGTVTSMTYGDSVNIADAYVIAINTPHVILSSSQYTVALYLGNTQINADATAQDYSQLDAGKYTLKFTLASSMDAQYALTSDSLDFEITPKEITVPTVKAGVTFTFNGLDQQLEMQLDGWDGTYMEWDLSSVHEAYHANTYTAVIKIKDAYAGNYVFKLPASTPSTTKKPVKALVAASASVPALSGDKLTATIPWSIEKYVYDTTTKNAWNFAKDGASLSFSGVPASIKALTLGDNPRLVFETAYFDLDGNPLTGELTIKGGDKYKVAAYLDPNCADANDIEFKGQTYDPMLQMTTSPQASYTVPKSGASAFMDNVKGVMTKTWLGLPIWAWLLIALALIILLIVIIVVCVKRRKTKEEREEKKALKEEERMRREEERRLQQERLEEERRLQREKLEAERELARAKQEAELEKIRAQAQAGMAGAGMATMAMQQPAQQQMPVQQPQTVDNNALARIEAEIAQINQKIANQQSAQSQFMPVPMQQQMQPQYYPVQQQMPMMQMPMMPQYGGGVGGEYSDLRADVRSMREEQRSDREVAALKKEMELEFAKMRNGGSYVPKAPAQIAMPADQESDGQPAQGNSAEVMGAIMAAFVKNMAMGNFAAPSTEPVQEPQTEEKPNVASASASYPSNAVITTTTTVDTTKGATSRSTQSDDGRLFDIDGFYDTFDANK